MLTGIAWDHRRCWGPLDASVAPYRQSSGLEVRWDRRSLYSFGEGDLGSYADKYDLVIYDHPFVGDISHHGWMLDLAPFLSAEQRAHFAGDEVGASWRSYAYDGGIWGLPLDTAAQAAAWRQDLLDAHGFAVPQSLSEVRQLAERGRAKGVAVGWPAVPTDLMCTLMSVAASMGRNPGHDGGDFLDPGDAEAAVGELAALARLVHPASKGWNPIRCLDHIATNDDLAYVPYLFNYVNYSSAAAGRRITFGRAPVVAAGQPAHTILGGAGIGISAKTKHPQAAFDYAMWLCSPQYQAGDYVKYGGQPGSRTAWTSEACNALTGDFFRSTLPVMDAAYLRPTHPGFVPFFHEATLRLATVVFEGASLRPFVDWLNQSYDRIRPAKVA